MAQLEASRPARGKGKGRKNLVCPLSRQPFLHPVIAADGNTFERKEIERWLETHDFSPVTKEPLAHRELIPNLAIRHAIEEQQSAPEGKQKQPDKARSGKAKEKAKRQERARAEAAAATAVDEESEEDDDDEEEEGEGSSATTSTKSTSSLRPPAPTSSSLAAW